MTRTFFFLIVVALAGCASTAKQSAENYASSADEDTEGPGGMFTILPWIDTLPWIETAASGGTS